MLSYEEYVEYYKKYGKTIDQMMVPKSSLNEKQLQRKYSSYVKKEEKKEEKFNNMVAHVDEDWERLKEVLIRRDGFGCKLVSIIRGTNLYYDLRENAGHLLNTIDVAHIFPKGYYKQLYYDIDDVVWLNRYSHSMLDSYRDPIRGKSISSTELSLWWRFIAGNDVYERLLEKIKG